MGPLASAWAIPLAAGGMASLVAIPLNVTWGVLARDWLGLPSDYAPAEPSALLVASIGICALVAIAFALAFRYTAEPLAIGSVAAGALLAMALPASIAMPLVAYPDVAGGAAFGLVAHLLAAATSFLIVFRGATDAGEAGEGIVAPHAD